MEWSNPAAATPIDSVLAIARMHYSAPVTRIQMNMTAFLLVLTGRRNAKVPAGVDLAGWVKRLRSRRDRRIARKSRR